MAAVDLLVPIIANIHWDDLLRKFVLRISEEYLRSQGNKRDKDTLDCPTLAEVFLKILDIWANVAFLAEGQVTYEIGDMSMVSARITEIMAMSPGVAIPEIPTPYNDTSTFDPGDWETLEDWGETLP